MRWKHRFAASSRSKTQNSSWAGRLDTHRLGTASASTSRPTALSSRIDTFHKSPLDKTADGPILLHDRGEAARSCSLLERAQFGGVNEYGRIVRHSRSDRAEAGVPWTRQ